ncbi:MAG: hypothetical protein Q9196_006309, partial [Gyalolechia fulgens]
TAPDAVTLLRVFCFCDPEGIPISIFEQGCDSLYQQDGDELAQTQAVKKVMAVRGFRHTFKRISRTLRRRGRSDMVNTRCGEKLQTVQDLFRSPLRLSKAIQEVQQLSLAACTLEGTDRIIRIHDLVHLLLRSKLMTDTERGQWLENTIYVVCKAFEGIGDRRSPANWSRCSRFVSHIESLEGFAEQNGLESHELLDAGLWAATYLHYSGLYENAATLNKRMLEQAERILGKKHPTTLVGMNNLALVLENQGKYEEAEGIYRQTLAVREPVLGQKHPDTLVSMNNLASVLGSQGKYEEAEGIHRQTVALQKSVLGKEHPERLSSMNNLALVLDSQGKYEEAERIHRQTLAVRESVLGKEHPETLSSMNNLACGLYRQGKYEEAEGIYRQTLALRESVLRKEHPDTLLSMFNLAITWEKQGRVVEAISLLQECSQLLKQILGSGHPRTQDSLDFLRELEEREV